MYIDLMKLKDTLPKLRRLEIQSYVYLYHKIKERKDNYAGVELLKIPSLTIIYLLSATSKLT